MNQKILLLFFILFAMTQAKMVDGIALIVEGDPITTAEIRALRTNLRLSKAKAIDLLIQDRLQKIAMKDIYISDEEIDTKIAQIAKENQLSIPKMQKILKQQGTPWTTYRQSVSNALKKVHFYQEVVAASIPEPEEDELKLYYNKHRNEFKLPKYISVREYGTRTEKELKAFLKTHKYTGVKTKTIRKKTKDLEPEMLSIFLQTPKNSYTRIFNAGDRYVVYKVIGISGKRIMPFEMAKKTVALAKWKQAQQEQALSDYFQKLRDRSNIQTLR